MKIYLQPVGEDRREVLFRMLQYSLYEESATDGNEIGNDGLYEYPYFDCYFTEPEREAYLALEEGTDRLAGFVMVNTYMQRAEAGHSIAEFMVLPGFRRLGVGSQMAKACFDKHTGTWEARPSTGSDRAFRFWERVVQDYTGGKYRFEEGIFIFSKED